CTTATCISVGPASSTSLSGNCIASPPRSNTKRACHFQPSSPVPSVTTPKPLPRRAPPPQCQPSNLPVARLPEPWLPAPRPLPSPRNHTALASTPCSAFSLRRATVCDDADAEEKSPPLLEPNPQGWGTRRCGTRLQIQNPHP